MEEMGGGVNCENIELVVVDSRQGGSPAWVLGEGLTIPLREKSSCY